MSNLDEINEKIKAKQQELDKYNKMLEDVMDSEEGAFYGVYDRIMEDIDKTVTELQELINQIK